MWDMRCTVDANVLSAIRTIVQFVFTDLPASSRTWWLVNENGDVDLCPIDLGGEPALQVRTTLRVMTRVWMGDLAIGPAQRSGQLTVLGPRDLRRFFGSWLRLSPYAPVANARRAPPRMRRDKSDTQLLESSRS
jgi:hypothetical protein